MIVILEAVVIVCQSFALVAMWRAWPTWADSHMGCLVTFKEILDQRDMAVTERVAFEQKLMELSFELTQCLDKVAAGRGHE